mmetsp:Transcript_56990/g.132900  ORF Transcript_56990/g.132900 Transcript_56990/m.132900 type:complete len:406 (-) Transcript_56990:1-1218(-)
MSCSGSSDRDASKSSRSEGSPARQAAGSLPSEEDLAALAATIEKLSLFHSRHKERGDGDPSELVEVIRPLSRVFFQQQRQWTDEQYAEAMHAVIRVFAEAVPPWPSMATQFHLWIGTAEERGSPPAILTPELAKLVFACTVRGSSLYEDVQDDAARSFFYGMCPPLMSSHRHPGALATLVESRERFADHVAKFRLGAGNMYREFVNLCIAQPFAFVYIDSGASKAAVEESETTMPASAVVSVTFETLSGLSSNAHLRKLLPVLVPQCAEKGDQLQMTGWTWLRRGGDLREWPSDCIWGEGIPDDIPEFDGRKVVVLFGGPISRPFSGAHTFPAIPVTTSAEASKVLGKEDRDAYVAAIRDTSTPNYIAALEHQKFRGGLDGDLERLIQQARGEVDERRGRLRRRC